MARRSIHVRLDDAASAALRVVQRDGLNESEAVRAALREAAEHRRRRSALRAEVEALAADPADRSEAAAVRRLMTDLAPDR